MAPLLTGKTILMIIAFDKFRDEEFFVPYNEFTKQEAKVVVASTKTGEAHGQMGGKAKVNSNLNDIRPEEYSAIIFVGGQGTPTIRSQEKALRIAQATSKKQVLAAICWAPTILAKAGMLQGKKATVWEGDDSEYNKATPEVLAQYGAQFVAEDVVVDENIVTANGAPAAEKFARAIIERLKKL